MGTCRRGLTDAGPDRGCLSGSPGLQERHCLLQVLEDPRGVRAQRLARAVRAALHGARRQQKSQGPETPGRTEPTPDVDGTLPSSSARPASFQRPKQNLSRVRSQRPGTSPGWIREYIATEWDLPQKAGTVRQGEAVHAFPFSH